MGTATTRPFTNATLDELYFAEPPRLRIVYPTKDLSEDVRKLTARPFECFSEREQKIALWRLRYMTALDVYFNDNPGQKRPELGYAAVARQVTEAIRAEIAETGEKLPPFIKDKIPGGSTLRRLYLRWIGAGRLPHVLVPLDAEKGNRDPKIHPEVEQQILKIVHANYFTREQKSLVDTHHIVCGSIDSINAKRVEPLQKPSYQALRRLIEREFDPYEVCYMREGKAVAEQRYGVGVPGPLTAGYMDVVQIDHSPLDLMALRSNGDVMRAPRRLRRLLISEAKRKESENHVGRPWISVAVDVATRHVVAFVISMDPPSASTVMRLLRMMACPEAELGPDTSWPRHGLPSIIVLDNEAAHHSNAVVSNCALLGIRIEFTPTRSPKSKAIVERLIGTIQRDFAVAPGRTFSSVERRGDYDSARKACVLFSELKEMFAEWCGNYHRTPHRGLFGLSPRQRYDALKHVGIRLPPDRQQLDLLLGTVIERTIQGDGITFCGLRYADRGRMLDRLRKSVHLGREWMVRIDPADLSRVAVLDDTDEVPQWLWIPCTTPSLVEGLDLDDWREIVAIGRNIAAADGRVDLAVMRQARLRFFEEMRARGSKAGRLPKPKSYTEIAEDESFFSCLEPLDSDRSENPLTARMDRRRSSEPAAASIEGSGPVADRGVRGASLPDFGSADRVGATSPVAARQKVAAAKKRISSLPEEPVVSTRPEPNASLDRSTRGELHQNSDSPEAWV